ncbi:30S ribosomal protein S28e [Candidatus Micrarchaeota archaeon]|nr:30S ribosomal protein S28e [Candidatus Micrarchaeota archaeon]
MVRERRKKGKESKKSSEVQQEQNLAVVLKVFGRTGVHGEVNHVLCKLISGRDKGKTLKRNIKGPVKVNDKIVLLETEREAKTISSRRR